MIEFLCPEGHKIRCPAEKAGRPAKCPKCGVGFRIPTIEELGLGESTVADSSLAGEEVADVRLHRTQCPRHPAALAGNPPFRPTPPEGQIEFLCPNGHHLHGPSSLQGRAGECPECGSRFRIPIIEEPEAEPEPLAEPEVTTEPELPGEEEITLENGTPLSEAEPIQPAETLEYFQVLEDGSGAARRLYVAAQADGEAVGS